MSRRAAPKANSAVRWRRWLVTAVLGTLASTSQGGGFLRAYEGALAHDPAYRAARKALQSTEQGVPIARAALLPNLSLSISDARVTGSRRADNFLGQPVTTDLAYRSPQQTLSLRAPLLNMDATQQVRQAQVQVEIGASVLLARRHDLLDRLGQAYLQRLYTLENLEVARSQVVNAAEQSQLALRRYQLGDGTRPEVQTTQADLALAQAQVSEAENQLTNARLVLAQISGLPNLPPEPLPEGFVPPPPEPANLAAWLDLAEQSNPEIIARRQGVRLAMVGVERASAGHYPRLDLVASASKGRNDSVSTLNQALSQRSIGLQLNLPLYSGGIVDASVTQAIADQEKAQAELEAEQLRVIAEVSRLFLSVKTGLLRLQAQQQALEATRLELEGARKGAAGGIGIRADAVRAQSAVIQAQRDLSRFRYEYVLALLRLHSRAGAAPDTIAGLIDDLFGETTRMATR
jgi:protease secretion system outer membrane protein